MPGSPEPMLRGVYFTSGTQEGSPIDRVLGFSHRVTVMNQGEVLMSGTPDEVRKVTWENASKLFRHPVPTELQLLLDERLLAFGRGHTNLPGVQCTLSRVSPASSAGVSSA